MPSERNVGQLGLGPFDLPVGGDNCRDTRQDLLAFLICTRRVKEHDTLGGALLIDCYGRGDRVIGGNRLEKFRSCSR